MNKKTPTKILHFYPDPEINQNFQIYNEKKNVAEKRQIKANYLLIFFISCVQIGIERIFQRLVFASDLSVVV